MKNVRRRLIRCAALSAFAVFAMSGSAFAGTIRYDIPPTSAYTVDNTEGIAKIEFVGCVTQNEVQTISFTTIVEASNAGTAEYKVLQDPSDTGELPVGTFSPNPVQLTGEATQSVATTLTFQLATVTASGTVFRFKLDPDEGTGLGEGPGVMVVINCVQAAAPVAGTTPVPVVPVPAPAAALAVGEAPCISLQRLTVRAGRLNVINATVRTPEGVVVSNAYVRLFGAGIITAGFTNESGVVTFNVLPTKSGVIVVQSNVCTGADQVNALAPLPLPSAVAAAAAGPAPCVTLRQVTLRAGRLAVVTAVVRAPSGDTLRGALVRITGVGVQRSGFTNASGVVTFRIRPLRSGTLYVQSGVCGGADRKAVLGVAQSPFGTGAGGASFTG